MHFLPQRVTHTAWLLHTQHSPQGPVYIHCTHHRATRLLHTLDSPQGHKVATYTGLTTGPQGCYIHCTHLRTTTLIHTLYSPQGPVYIHCTHHRAPYSYTVLTTGPPERSKRELFEFSNKSCALLTSTKSSIVRSPFWISN